MKRLLCVVSLAVLFCFTFTCQKAGKGAAREPEASVDADVAAIKALFDEWVQLYNKADFERLISIYYAENAIMMPPNELICKGKDAILLWYQKASELTDEHVDSSVVEDVRVSGNLAAVCGIDMDTSTPRGGGAAVKYSVKSLTVFERQPSGSWKCICEIWNDNPLPETSENKHQD
jgi:ketosteroid isomerase-like protein